MKSVMLLPISLGIGLCAVVFGTFTPYTTWTFSNEIIWHDYSTSGLSQDYYTAYRIENSTTNYTFIDRAKYLESLVSELQEAQNRLAVLQGQKLA